jgi:heptaprenyl diphosphate synthase
MNDRVVKLARLALLLALATVIHTAEGLLPITFVWFRFGFANIIGLAALELFGFKDAILVTLGRIFLGSMAYGLFGSPVFMMSLAGGICAILAMGLAYGFGTRIFSEIGVSVTGAVAHNVAQLAVAYFLVVRNEGILMLLPVLLLTAAATGFINGLAARFFVNHFKSLEGHQIPSLGR